MRYIPDHLQDPANPIKSFRQYATLVKKLCLRDSDAWDEFFEGMGKEQAYLVIISGWKMNGVRQYTNKNNVDQAWKLDHPNLPLVQRPIPLSLFKHFITQITLPRARAVLPAWWHDSIDNPGILEFFEDRIKRGLEESTTMKDLEKTFGDGVIPVLGSISIADTGACSCAKCIYLPRRW